MNIVMIGSGNVATHLSTAMYKAGHRIEQVWSRNASHARDLANEVEANAIDDLRTVCSSADYYIIAVPDDAISSIAGSLPHINGIVIHTSGSVSIEVLKQTNTDHGVLWFPHSFVKNAKMDYSSLNCCVESSSPKTGDKISELVKSFAGHIYHINSQQRRWAHLSSVMANNFTHALNAMTEEMMNAHNLDFQIIRPLILETAMTAQQDHLSNYQTGPAIRGDIKTIESHRALLANTPEVLNVYNALTALIQERSKSSK